MGRTHIRIAKRRNDRKLARIIGKSWGEWRQIAITPGMINQHPFFKDCAGVYANNRYEVHIFNCSSPIGGIVQANIIRHLDVDEMTWDELDRIIHELFGDEVYAVELYPPTYQCWMTKTNIRVLWVLPKTWDLPFGLHRPESWGRSV